MQYSCLHWSQLVLQSTPASFSWKLLACSDLSLWYPQPEQLCPLLCSHLVLGNASLEWFSLLKLSKYDRKKKINKTQQKQLFLFQLSCHLYRDLSEILRISFVVLLKSSAPPCVFHSPNAKVQWESTICFYAVIPNEKKKYHHQPTEATTLSRA